MDKLVQLLHLKRLLVLCIHKCQYLIKFLILSEVSINDTSDDNVELKDLVVKIEDLNLTARSYNALDRNGIKYLGELVLMSEVEVKNIKNLGTKSYNEIAEKLESLGYPVENTLPENILTLKKKIRAIKSIN